MSMIEALLLERAGYASIGLDDRVAEVDAQLAYYGLAVEDGEDIDAVEDGVTDEPDGKRRKG